MTFTTAEVQWLEAVTGKDVDAPAITPESIEAALEAEAAREHFLNEALTKTIDKNRDFISKAQEFSITNPNADANTFWGKITRSPEATTMAWRAEPGSFGSNFSLSPSYYDMAADHEVDTRADIRGDTEEIPPDVVQAANDAIASILEAQQHMLRQFDKAGNRLFSDEDIRRELWTPLVRQGVIPENMVPDRFSEEAVAFGGAKSVYEDKLEAYTQTTTGREGALRVLRIGKDVIEMVGTVAVSANSMANAMTVVPLEKQLKGLDANSPAAKAIQDQIDAAKQGETIAASVKAVALTTASFTETMVEKGKYKGQPGYALDVVRSLVSAVDSSVGSITTAGLGAGGKVIATGIQAALKGVNIGAKLVQINGAQTDAERIKMIAELIGEVGDAVATSMNAYAAKLSTTDKAAGKAFEAQAEKVSGAFKTTSSAVVVYDALKSGDYEGASRALVADAFEQIVSNLAGEAHESLEGGLEGVKNEENRFTALSPSEAEKYLEGILKKVEDDLAGQDAAALQKQLEEAFNDPEAVEDMFDEWDKELEAVAETYASARPRDDLDDLEPEKAEEALKAIDRAMAATATLRARAELINAITATSAAIVASFVPGLGAVTAAQKVAYDIYCLVKAVEMHNKWVDSMEVAFRANSAYAAAVQRTLNGAKITLSQKSVALVLDSLQLGAQVGRCFDPTGGATIASSALTMTQALVEFGYKMHKEAEIVIAWRAYKTAIDEPGNRKAARKAMRLNSTLAKCAIAYGACMGNDPVAKEAISISGLSPELLADDKQVCQKLVSYLENELTEDPVVLQARKSARPWHPSSQPLLTPESWFEFKAAAMKLASPPLAPESANTPAINKALSGLHALWNKHASYDDFRKSVPPDADDKASPKRVEIVGKAAEGSIPHLETLLTAFGAYAPKALVPSNPKAMHDEMAGVVKTLLLTTKIALALARQDVTAYEAEKKRIEDEKKRLEEEKAQKAKAPKGDGGKSGDKGKKKSSKKSGSK